MLYTSLIASAVGLFALLRVMRNPKGSPGKMLAVGVPAAVLLPMLCLSFFPGLALTMTLATAAAVVWHYAGRPQKAVAPVLGGAVLIGHLTPFALWVAPDLRRYAAIRDGLTALDADARLTRPANPALDSVPISTEAVASLENAVVRERGYASRQFEFARMHDRQVDLFVNHPGFGVMRMTDSPRETEYYLPRREPILQPGRLVTSQARPTVEHPVESWPGKPESYHRGTIVQFVFPFGWGWERSPGEFLGFQPHQMGRKAKAECRDADWSPAVADGWSVSSIDLIGLVVHEKPTVYMTDHLPRMDEAKTAPTREPDAFEAAGLKAVAGGDEVYVGRSRTEPVLRMVGGIRAAKACTTCHGCREGELLGAFGYVLTK